MHLVLHAAVRWLVPAVTHAGAMKAAECLRASRMRHPCSARPCAGNARLCDSRARSGAGGASHCALPANSPSTGGAAPGACINIPTCFEACDACLFSLLETVGRTC